RVPPGDWELILDLTIQACDGLAHAHRYGVVHRDVKPANLLLREDGGLCVTDFGLVKMTGAEETPVTVAREPLPEKLEEGVSLELAPKPGTEWSSWTLTRTGALLGTPEYSAPEQWEGRGVAVQADIYALGVLLFELCCGRRPFDDGTKRTEPSLLIARHMSKDPPNPREFRPDLPKNLDTVILQCLAKRPKERPPSMLDLRERLTFLYRTVVGKTYPRPIPKPGVQRAAALNNKAVSFWNLGKSQEAFGAWREASKLDALHPETVYNRSVLQWRLGQIRSTEVLHRLAQVKTAYPRAGVFLGLYYLEQFDPQAAEVELNTALELPHVASEGLAWRALGDSRMYQARFPEAMQAYQAALRQIPDDHEALVRADLASRKERGREGKILFPSDSPLPVVVQGEAITALAFCPEGGLVAAIGDGLERISPEGHRQWRWQMSLLEGQGKSIRRLAVAENLVVSLESAGGRVWSLDRGRSLLALDERERFFALLDGGHRALAGLIELRRLTLPEGTPEVVFAGHTKRVTSVAFTSDQSKFLSGSWDTTLRLWDTASGECLQVFEGHTDLVEAVGVTPDGALGLSGGRDRSLRFWSLATGGCLWVRPSAGEVRSIDFCSAGRHAVVGYGRPGEAGGVELWDVSTGDRLFHREGGLVG
ncbi:MAG: protein kinase, partial [Candidatus Eremiobacteraeota bacterium]|nr:protein kinase [Candidatus Eremiobacteraeota bacterium]